MSDYIKVNEDDFVHLTTVKRLRVVSDEERGELAKLGNHVNAERFNTRLDHAGGAKSYAQESVNEIASQGVALVEVDDGAFVPAQSIGKVRDITDEDRASFEQRTGRAMRPDFKSRIETRAGLVLSTADSATVMQRMSDRKQPQPAETPAAPSMEDERDAAMANAAPAKNKPGRKRSREPEA